MNRRELVERISAEITKAAADGDDGRARKLADLQSMVVAQISRDSVADGFTDAVAVPLPRRGQLAVLPQRISTQALSAELAAERGEWEAVHASYERLVLLYENQNAGLPSVQRRPGAKGTRRRDGLEVHAEGMAPRPS